MIDWRHWHNEPYLVGGLLFLAWLYAVLTGPLREWVCPGIGFERGKAWCFHLSLLVFYCAVGSPLDQLGERFLLSAHMLQHQLLVYPAAILFLRGVPAWMAGVVMTSRLVSPLFSVLCRPLVCALIYVLTLSIWHFPPLYEWALQDKLVHVVEHLTMFAAALFLWWPFFSPSREFPPASHGVQMLLLVGVTLGMTPVFAYITFAQGPLYPTYEYAPRIIADFSAQDDQILAGALMKLGGMSVSFIAFGWSFYCWYAGQRDCKGSSPRPAAFA